MVENQAIVSSDSLDSMQAAIALAKDAAQSGCKAYVFQLVRIAEPVVSVNVREVGIKD